METRFIYQILKNTDDLIASNLRLVKSNELSLKIIQHQSKTTAEVTAYLKEEYQALKDKKKRSIQEESQFLFIEKLLTKNQSK